MRRRFALTAAAAAVVGSAAFVIPATPASADPIVCLDFGACDSLAAPPPGGCIPPAELDFLNLPFPTIVVPIPDVLSLLGSIQLPTIPFPSFPGTPSPPTETVSEDGTTVIDDSSQPPTTDTTTTD